MFITNECLMKSLKVNHRCGRFFEGTPTQMHISLNKILSSLPDDTKVYCGHEYTVSNLKFARSVEPLNASLIAKLEWAMDQTCTVPSTIGDEKKFNPFMRVHVPEIAKASGVGLDNPDPVMVMERLREMKNNFRG
jgi:hydroxyacylglutathione hydrolase